ncbi:MAG: molybdopterin-dependent oxidoreductase [Rhodospirillaceae bacterium]
MPQLSLMIDLERCIGCKSCEAACKAEHGLGPGENRNRVVWLGNHDNPGLDFLTLSCQHCERPACLRACPVSPKAIFKDADTGVVRVMEDRCTGCGECVVACPYGAMGYDPIDHHSVKCDLCHDRREAGLNTACATVCPGEAISFGAKEDHLARAQAEGRTPVDHDAFLLNPSNIFLERIKGRPGAAPEAFTMAGRAKPAVVDDPARKKMIAADDVAFPYRSERDDRLPDAIIPGGCSICFNCCPTKYHLKDGKVIRVTGNEDDPQWKGKVCPKSQFLLQLHNSPDRLTQPLKRVGARGEGKFKLVSWDQVLGEISAKLSDLRDRHGPETLAIFAGTRTGTLTRKGYIRLFTQMWGTPNFSDTEAFCSESKRVSFLATLGGVGSGNSYTPADIGSAGMYLYLGDNQAESRPVHFGMVNNWRLKNGARMVVCDPRLTVTASKADTWHPISPGTDLALVLALCHHILSNDLHDKAFCENWVAGWDAWRDFIFERAYTPDWAAAITGIDAADIRQLAEDIARADGCVIFGARGINQHANGTQTNRALIYLASITGNMGRRGGAYFNFGTSTPVSADAPLERRVIPERDLVGVNPSAWLDAMQSAEPYPLKALITANNPMTAWPNQSRVRDAFKSLDLLVHIDLFQNETSAYADYVLPAASGIEKGEIARASEDRRIVWIDKMIEPPGDAKPDDWFWIELGKRFGFDDVLKDDYKDPAKFWDEMCIGHPDMSGITYARLQSKPNRTLRAPLKDETSEEIETLYLEGTTAPGKPDGHRFPTKSGKIEIWTEAVEAAFRPLGLSALPEFYTDEESLIDAPYVARDWSRDAAKPKPYNHEATTLAPARIVQPADGSPARKLRDQGFDMQLVTGRPPAPHFHSWTHYSWQAQEMWPDMFVQIHPEKAKTLGIDDGETVAVETAHGQVTGRAWLHAGIRRDTVFIPIGWDARQPFHPWKSVNFLTDESQRDPLSDHANLKGYLCRVRPVA